MSKATPNVRPAADLSKLDRTDFARETWRAAYRQSRSMIVPGRSGGLGTRYVWFTQHAQARFGLAAARTYMAAGRIVLHRRTACFAATGSLADIARQGMATRAERIERCCSWYLAWSLDPLAGVNGRRADRAFRAAKRRDVARIMAEDRFALTVPGLLVLRAAEAARATA